MTQERKDELYEQMIEWICEHIKNDEDLFYTLNGHFGMNKEELHDHSIESLDRFFTVQESAEEETVKIINETVPLQNISLYDFISEMRDMINGEDKTIILDWIEFAAFMTDADESDKRTLEKELQEVYLPLCYVRNNFSNSVLQQSLNMDTLGNEIIYGAMLFVAGYGEEEVREMANEGVLEDGYIPLGADEERSLFVISILDREDIVFIGNSMDSLTTSMHLKRAIQFAKVQSCDIVDVLRHSATAGFPLRMITDERLIEAVKISCTESSAFDYVTVYDPINDEIKHMTCKGLSVEERDMLFAGSVLEQQNYIPQQM